MGIAAQVAKHRCWTSHRLLDIDNPVFPIQRLKKSPECLGIFQRPGGAAEAELVSAISPFQSVENLPRKTFLRTPSGRKKRYRGLTQWLRSAARPPTDTRQWMCG